MKTSEEIMKAKSVHIFAWPFRFKLEKKGLLEHEVKQEIKQKGWRKKSIDFANLETDEGKNRDASDCFMLYQYLSQAARDIFIFSNICTIYEYPFEDGKKYEYYIKRDDKEYVLPIASIELHVYEYGVGILFFQVWNEKYSVDDIKQINDYGRRVSLPYLAKEKLLCADILGILIDGVAIQKTDFQDIAIKCMDKELKDPGIALKQAGFLEDLLNCNLNHSGKNSIQVISHTDDRMFVCTLIRDTQLSAMIAGGMKKEELLYSILFIDPDDATCQNADMRKKLLEDAVYARWSDWGTVYGVTAYSLCCITTDAECINESVIRPFIVEYSYLVSLVLAQRIGIISFTVQTGKVIARFNNKRNRKRNGIGYFQAVRLSQIQKQYIDFKNRLLILEASTQDQGIEIYQLLQKQMLVKNEQDILDGKLQSLYEAANISIGNRLSVIGILLAFAALFPGVGDKILEKVFEIYTCFQLMR